MRALCSLLLFAVIACFPATGLSDLPEPSAGLSLSYSFDSVTGNLVPNLGTMGKSGDLQVRNLSGNQAEQDGLVFSKGTSVKTPVAPGAFVKAVRQSQSLTIEAWVVPADTRQQGPARIVTLSKNTSERNFTLGQENDRFDFRLRTTKTGKNGLPSLQSRPGTVKPVLTHVVFTREKSGRSRIYLNGKLDAENKFEGQLENWDGGFQLGLGDELSGGRSWSGAMRTLSIFSRAVNEKEVAARFRAGPGAEIPAADLAGMKADRNAEVFETHVAPLLSEHCLECHDSATSKGDLDLSRFSKEFAQSGMLVPGQPDESLLWESVRENDMPHDRPPLNKEEKELLRTWIKDGAKWSLDRIDPALYVHGNQGSGLWVQRLTVPEYIATVKATTGVDIGERARELLPADLRADGFSNTAYNLAVDLKHVEVYRTLASEIVAQMDIRQFVERYHIKPDLTDDSMRALVRYMGAWIFRGAPLENYEIDPYRGITTTVASAGGGYEEAVSLVLEAMLQSPRFLYRIEPQQGDGHAWPADSHVLASRLSYILWGASPDLPLHEAATKDKLQDDKQLQNHIDRMLADPRARDRYLQFIGEWLDLDRMAHLSPSPDRFPEWSPELAAAMRKETLIYAGHIGWDEKKPLADLLDSPVTFANRILAKHYGLPAPATGDGTEFVRYDLTGNPERSGLLTHGSILTIGGDDASMVTRGLFVLHDLLRGVVKAPPPCVDTSPVPSKPGLSQRGIAMERIDNKNCGGCHSRFEPLAFALEKYDGIGMFHQQDKHGNPLREDGEILFPGEPSPVSYDTSSELMSILSESDRVRECLTWKVAQFALGRPLGAGDARSMQKVHETAMKNGGTYADTVRALLLSDLVRTSRTEAPGDETTSKK